MSINNSDIKKAQQIAEEFLRLLRVNLTPEVSANTSGLRINLVGKDSAIIIGYHGETLSDLNYILGIIIRHQLDKDISVRIDSGEYLKNKDRRIVEIAQKAIEKTTASGFPERITGLNSYERRIVHEEVSKNGLISESSGTGRDRAVIVRPQRENKD
ncbi:MAG: R3H domain-containing nucleic acid-binding protein [bacterium]